MATRVVFEDWCKGAVANGHVLIAEAEEGKWFVQMVGEITSARAKCGWSRLTLRLDGNDPIRLIEDWRHFMRAVCAYSHDG